MTARTEAFSVNGAAAARLCFLLTFRSTFSHSGFIVLYQFFFLSLSRTKELNCLNEIAGTDLRQQKKQNELNERIERFFFFTPPPPLLRNFCSLN